MQSVRPAPSPRHAPAAAPHLQERSNVFNLARSACFLVSLLGISNCGLPGQHLASCPQGIRLPHQPSQQPRPPSCCLVWSCTHSIYYRRHTHVSVERRPSLHSMSLKYSTKGEGSCGLRPCCHGCPFAPHSAVNASPQPQLSSSLIHTYLAYEPQVLARGPQTMRDDRDREPIQFAFATTARNRSNRHT